MKQISIQKEMHAWDIIEGIHTGCGGFIKVYSQNSPPANHKFLVGCPLCGNYYETDTPPIIEGSGEVE